MAFLSLGNDDEGDEDNETEEEDQHNAQPNELGSSVRRKHIKGTVDGLAQFRDMLQPEVVVGQSSSSSHIVHQHGLVARIDPSNSTASSSPSKGKKNPRKRKRKNKFADVCMFAELLEIQTSNESLYPDSEFYFVLLVMRDILSFYSARWTSI